MTAPQAAVLPFCPFCFCKRTQCPKEKRENGSQPMLMDQTLNPNLTKSQCLAAPYQCGNVKHRRDTNTFLVPVLQCSKLCGRVSTSDKTK